MKWLKGVMAFGLAVVITAVAGAVVHSQFIVANMAEMGHPVALGDRIAWTGHDIVGMFSTYAPIIALAFVLAFPIAAHVSRRLNRLRTFGYTLAGAAAIVCALLVMKQMLDISGVAGARTALGIAAQGLAGALGGWLFALTSRARTA